LFGYRSPPPPMASLAKAILMSPTTEEYDLDGYGPADCDELATGAFKDPIVCTEMIRLTFVVGGGKKVRQKYSPDLPKMLCDSLRAVGYEEDKGAALSLDSQGTFKYQHDTGKDLKYIHVFPFVTIQEVTDNTLRIGGYRVDSMPPEIKCMLCEMDTFKGLVKDKCPTFSQKRALLRAMKGVQTRFEEFEKRMTEMQPLTPEEKELYESQVEFPEKLEYLTKLVQDVVGACKVNKPEQDILIREITEKMKKAEAAIKEAAAEGKKTTKLEAQRDTLAGQLAKLKAATPIVYKRKHAQEIAEIRDRIAKMKEQMAPLVAIQDAEGKVAKLRQEQEGWYWTAVPVDKSQGKDPKKK